MNPEQPFPYILFMQHGWHDTNRRIYRLGQSLVNERTQVIAPNLGLVKTWWRIEPLINQVEQVAIATHQRYPNHPWRIVGHSMGGLIWLEVLQRHPEWWGHIDSVSLVGSPVGGADLGRIFDPFRWGIGIARDLGTDRRRMAEELAQQMPIQIIASDYDGGSDGTVPIQCSQFRHGRYTQLKGISHANMKDHPDVTDAIQQFWATLGKSAPALWVASTPVNGLEDAIVAQLQTIDGMTDTHPRYFNRARIWTPLTDGLSLRTWRHPLGIHHVFLANAQNQCCFAGFVGWSHTRGMYENLALISGVDGPTS